METIVVGVDGAEHAHGALVQAAREAAAHHSPCPVLVVHDKKHD